MANCADMVLDRVDPHDRPVGTVLRKDALRSGARFRVVHVLLFDEDSRLALQEIAVTHGRHPGWWGSSVAGYVRAGEPYEEAATRKLEEELGLSDCLVEFIGKTQMQDGRSTKFIGVFAVQAPRNLLRPNPDDFQSIDFASLDELRTELCLRGRPFTPTFQHVIRFSMPRFKANR